MKVLIVLILTLQLIIPLNTAFGLIPYDSINQRADFVDFEKDPYDYVLQYKSDKEFRKWFDENYPDVTIYNAVGLEEPVLITQSRFAERTIIDGKWSNGREWKESVDDGWLFSDGNGMILRATHQDEYLYFLVDFISDRTHDTNMDRAMICLDSNNDKNKISENDDHCFVTSLERSSVIVLQGGSQSALDGNFKRIYHQNVFGAGTVSDHNDRYSTIPHSSYEFKIPTELVGRHAEYGLYIALYDNHNDMLYSWPRYIEPQNNFQIPPPNQWGELVSLDKSLPEFNLPLLVVILTFSTLIILTKTKGIKIMKNLY